MVYSDSLLVMGPKSALVIYGDGVTEAASGSGDMFGEERLEALLLQARRQAADALMRRVLEGVDAFVAGADQADDISLIVIRRGPSPDVASPLQGQ